MKFFAGLFALFSVAAQAQDVGTIVNTALQQALPDINKALPGILQGANLCPYNINKGDVASAHTNLLELSVEARSELLAIAQDQNTREGHELAATLISLGAKAKRTATTGIASALVTKLQQIRDEKKNEFVKHLAKSATDVQNQAAVQFIPHIHIPHFHPGALINDVLTATASYHLGTVEGLCSVQIANITVAAESANSLSVTATVISTSTLSIDVSGSASVTSLDIGPSLSATATVDALNATATGVATITDIGKVLQGGDKVLEAFTVEITSLDIQQPNINLSFGGIASVLNPVVNLVIFGVKSIFWSDLKGVIDEKLVSVLNDVFKGLFTGL